MEGEVVSNLSYWVNEGEFVKFKKYKNVVLSCLAIIFN